MAEPWYKTVSLTSLRISLEYWNEELDAGYNPTNEEAEHMQKASDYYAEMMEGW